MQPVMTIWTVGVSALTLATYLQIVGMSQLFFSPELVFQHHQYWRIITTFFYFGELNFSSLLYWSNTLFFGYSLEQNTFGSQRRADFVWLIALSATTLLCLSSVLAMPYLSMPLSNILTTIWCRKNRQAQISLMGIITITAPYLPIAHLVLDLLLGFSLKDLRGELASIAIAHLCMLLLTDLFFTTWWPREYSSSGKNVLAAPDFLCVVAYQETHAYPRALVVYSPRKLLTRILLHLHAPSVAAHSASSMARAGCNTLVYSWIPGSEEAWSAGEQVSQCAAAARN